LFTFLVLGDGSSATPPSDKGTAIGKVSLAFFASNPCEGLQLALGGGGSLVAHWNDLSFVCDVSNVTD